MNPPSRLKAFVQHLSHDYLDDEDEQRGYELMWESLPLVGMVVMHFNMLEKLIDSAICDAISDRSDALGLLVIHGMQYGAKVDMFKRFCDDAHQCMPTGTPPQYKGIAEGLIEAGRLRNLVVHADWFHTDAQGYTYARLKLTKRGMEQEYVQLTPDSLEDIVERINQTMGAVDRYLMAYDFAVYGYSRRRGDEDTGEPGK